MYQRAIRLRLVHMITSDTSAKPEARRQAPGTIFGDRPTLLPATDEKAAKNSGKLGPTDSRLAFTAVKDGHWGLFKDQRNRQTRFCKTSLNRAIHYAEEFRQRLYPRCSREVCCLGYSHVSCIHSREGKGSHKCGSSVQHQENNQT